MVLYHLYFTVKVMIFPIVKVFCPHSKFLILMDELRFPINWTLQMVESVSADMKTHKYWDLRMDANICTSYYFFSS